MGQTLLIGLDGATFTVLDPLMKSGVMPFLKQLCDEGVRAELMSTAHPLTPPAFVSLATGRSPGQHGVFDFIRGEDSEGDVFFTLYDSRDVKCETIWSIAGRQDRRIATLNYTLTAPAAAINGYVIPGMVHWKHLRRHVFPTNLYDELKAQSWFDPKVMCWDVKHMENAIAENYTSKIPPAKWVSEQVSREKQWAEALRFIMEKEQTDLISVVFDGPDKLQHVCWNLIDPELFPENPEPWQVEVRDLCHEYFRMLDGFLRMAAEAAGPDARFFIVSDHGFGPAYVTLRINQFLKDLGYLEWKQNDDASAESDDVPGFDWTKTVAYCPTQSSNGIFIRQARNPGEPGIPPSEYRAFRENLVARLMELTDPETGDKIVKEVLLNDETFAGIAMRNAPDITVILKDNGFVWTSPGENAVERKPEIKGTHYPEGIFIASGAGVRKGIGIERLSILDIAPSILYSLGLPVPSNFEGHVPTDAFDPDYLAANPVQIGSPAGEGSQASEGSAAEKEDVFGDEEKKAVYDQLRALGYVE